MIGVVRVKSGRSSMVIRGPDAAAIEAELRSIFGPAVNAAENHIDAVYADMQRTFPVFTGAARKSFEKYILVTPAQYRIEVGLRSDLPAVRFIKSTKHGTRRNATRNRSPLQTDVMQPIKARAPEYKAQAEKLLEEALRRMVSRG
jgi:hypothetical protein